MYNIVQTYLRFCKNKQKSYVLEYYFWFQFFVNWAISDIVMTLLNFFQDGNRWRHESISGSVSIVRMSLCTKFCKDISFHGWVMTTSGFGKRTAAILQFYFRFRFQPAICHHHLVLRRRSEFYVNRTIGGVVLTSLMFSRWRPLASRINFRFRFGCAHLLRRPGCLSVPNFVKISRSTAEL